MVWCKPVKTLGGRTFWQDIKVNQYFKLQKHVAEGHKAGQFFGNIRSIWGSNKLFRIIMNISPYYCISEGDALEEVNKFLIKIHKFKHIIMI